MACAPGWADRISDGNGPPVREGDIVAQRVLETGTTDLLAELEHGVAVLTLNRPERRNALSDAMIEALAATLAACDTDPGIRCIILTGAGGAFCAGGDVKAFAEAGALNVAGTGDTPLHEKIERQRRQQRATAGRLHEMPKPTIGCLEGAAAGAGLGLALACDLRIASETSVMVTAFARVGLSGDYGVTWFLTRMLGTARALELLLLSEKVTAEHAQRIGLVNRVTPPGEALNVSRQIAAALAAGPAVAHQAIKGNVSRAIGGDLMTCMDLEVSEAMRCAATEDHAAAVAAFAARQAPTFRGR
jgi:2-(1,2-epoxy-1,2-dihydrophenyl)acetyl-CoA isomerase